MNDPVETPETPLLEAPPTSESASEVNEPSVTPIPDVTPIESLHCTACQSPRTVHATYCTDCGYIFADENSTRFESTLPAELIGGRYRVEAIAHTRAQVTRFRGWDQGTSGSPIPIMIVREGLQFPTPIALTTPLEGHAEFDLPADGEQGTDELLPDSLPSPADAWPSIAWEKKVLQAARHLSLPRVLETLDEDGFRHLLIEVPTGQSLWDAWDRPKITWRERFTWLIQIAEALQALHQAHAIVEELRPEMFVVTTTGQVILTDLACLLPLPLPDDVPLRGSLSSAPELLLRPTLTNEQADVYVFGALLYTLLMGRELTDLDFSLAGKPRSFLERFPDGHPLLARLLAKTFVREMHYRFPTEDGSTTDASGFTELVEALHACKRTLDRVHLDISAWSNTGMTRSGNEDAVAILHSAEGRLNDTDEFALILLADGMGGMESGEIAAAITLQVLRQRLLNVPPFLAFQSRTPVTAPLVERLDNTPVLADPKASKTAIVANSKFAADGLMINPNDRDTAARNVEAYRDRLVDALKEANRQVYDAARHGFGGRGMGCTAEAIIIDGSQVVVGHVGDSRVYHMSAGHLTQVTRDQTFVQRMVDLGQLTPEQAEIHPRRAELEQAVGGRSEIFPDVFTATLVAGDWLLVCSDGLSNQLPPTVIEHVLSTSPHADKAARRLINLALEDGAFDNVTVAIVHATS